ncbi:hypothetical protein [Neptuniibacter sp.]|uniref:hypothetical protein n=1 Tax=Neptuniibacter sp. TaxID=1962643 RepID=UPI00260BFC12|nr:hypothetical protein [Neptuniibacter sp.]MCP4597927.1 hypothetical protein [Neptuniibacter sp.]
MPKITSETVHDPNALEKCLRSIVTDLDTVDTKLDIVVTLINELKSDTNAQENFLTDDGIVTATVLSAGSTTHQIKNTAFQYRIDGTPIYKAEVAAGTAFSAADTINVAPAVGTFWGIWTVQIDIAGTITTKPGGGLSDQVYTTEALAIAAKAAVTAGNVEVGYLTIAATADTAWTAQTDDITSGSDNTSVTFYPASATITLSQVAAADATGLGTLSTSQS